MIDENQEYDITNDETRRKWKKWLFRQLCDDLKQSDEMINKKWDLTKIIITRNKDGVKMKYITKQFSEKKNRSIKIRCMKIKIKKLNLILEQLKDDFIRTSSGLTDEELHQFVIEKERLKLEIETLKNNTGI